MEQPKVRATQHYRTLSNTLLYPTLHPRLPNTTQQNPIQRKATQPKTPTQPNAKRKTQPNQRTRPKTQKNNPERSTTQNPTPRLAATLVYFGSFCLDIHRPYIFGEQRQPLPLGRFWGRATDKIVPTKTRGVRQESKVQGKLKLLS